MTPPTHRTRTAVAVITVAAAALAACTGQPAPPPSPAPPPTASSRAPLPPPPPVTTPNLSTVDRSNPDAVAVAVLTIAAQIDTTRDTSFSDGLRRAFPLLSPAYAADVNAAPTPTTDSDWQQWTQHQAYTQASLRPSPEDRPPDAAAAAYRPYMLTRTPTGRDGWRGPPQQLIALVTLDRQPTGWAVANIDYR